MNRIVHLMLDNFYMNGYGYQENIITRKHKELGLDVHIVTYNQGGAASYNLGIGAPLTYMNPDGIPVHVLASNKSILRKIPFVVGWVNATIGVKEKLEELRPDYIFVHGICKHDNLEVISYVRHHPEVRLYADNHSDYYNSPVNTLRGKSYRYVFGRYAGRLFGKYARKVWGVTPWRVAYLENVYGVPPEKTDLLVMGGDERLINWTEKDNIRKTILSELNIPENAFVIITGGKIDRAKNIHILIDAIRLLHRSNVYLIIFGKVESDMIDCMEAVDDNNIRNLGWIGANDCYDLFLASDLAVFPGTHSVLWEQACASGLPAIFKDWDGGFGHVDVGGNCVLIKEVSPFSMRDLMAEIIDDEQIYSSMKKIAETKGREVFSYIEIGKKSIEWDIASDNAV